MSISSTQDGRYNLSKGQTLGDWIVKTLSIKHKDVPLNEFTAITLATMTGVDLPEIRLVELDKLDNLPPINLPDEKLALRSTASTATTINAFTWKILRKPR